jgi:outer membrane receptor protein involved in Fe transport
MTSKIARLAALGLLLRPLAARAQTTPPLQQLPVVVERVEVTATRVAEAPSEVPVNIEVFTGDELRARGASDLGSALALAAGVGIAPGGDAGPAGAVPEFWGLKEFDAFLLIVDGVPWGGAFNPALTLLSLVDVDRIEVLRGPAPVMYGATSFVGVIQVVHTPAAAESRAVEVRGGSYASGGGMFAAPIQIGSWKSRLTFDAERQGYTDDRTRFGRGHVSWRAAHDWTSAGQLFLGLDAMWTNQDPASPRPREGRTLSASVPVDANHNPDGSYLDDRRITVSGGFERPLGPARWSTQGSFATQSHDILRGFLQSLDDEGDNARGIVETIDLSDVYVDSHVAWPVRPRLKFIAGGDLLFGEGKARGADFDYQASVSGVSVPQAAVPTVLDLAVEDRRVFLGGYGQVEWRPAPSLRIDGGIRLNVTSEEREGAEGESQGGGAEEERNRQTHARPSGSVGAIWTAWSTANDYVRVFGNYRNTFKPAAFDFGLAEAEGGEEEGLLDPETSQSVEGGIKLRRGSVGVEGSAFLMDFHDLVMATAIDGLPALVNGGSSRFKGIEAAGTVQFPQAWMMRVTYAFHDARFADFVQDFDGVLTQLSGKQHEMSARQLAAVGVFVNPSRGLLAGAEWSYTGKRYMDKRNRAPAPGFSTLALGGGYRAERWEVRVDVRNLTDARDPVSESELGDAQYYLMVPRRVDASLRVRF